VLRECQLPKVPTQTASRWQICSLHTVAKGNETKRGTFAFDDHAVESSSRMMQLLSFRRRRAVRMPGDWLESQNFRYPQSRSHDDQSRTFARTVHCTPYMLHTYGGPLRFVGDMRICRKTCRLRISVRLRIGVWPESYEPPWRRRNITKYRRQDSPPPQGVCL